MVTRRFLGVDQVTVPNGDVAFPVLTNRPVVGGPHADSTEVAETTGAFSAELVKPERLQCAFTYKRVDVARFPVMGESLRASVERSTERITRRAGRLWRCWAPGRYEPYPHTHKRRSTRSRRTCRNSGLRASMAGTRRACRRSRVLMGSGGYAHAGSVYRGDQSHKRARSTV